MGSAIEALQHLLGIGDLLRRVRRLERHMSAVDDVLEQLNQATNDIADDLTRLRDEVAGGDAATAAKFEPLVTRLQQLAVDPENPVPPTA